ncbi:PAS domain S-box-containing protein [Pontibacter ummariensis]|uniref:histidine kinase n=1 Tax=Pontibacter ummariensis TaxID=1610492 RepID=A0A239I0E7_9BACT|nr:PAS domain-containing protein [Pontibacter ummariensis]PRY10158.1 PAS domain S-box-containing protein [Pontibacter ummariensis]SNS87110.1 PAS domain S-box-containing protein [Pontibacter ummariensis]
MTQVASLTPEVLHLLETVPDLYLILSPDFIILTASARYLKATYTEREKIQGRLVFDIFPDNPALQHSEATTNLRYSLEWVLAHKQPHEMGLLRYDILEPGQVGAFQEKYWRSSHTPVLDGEGNIQYIIHKTIDVTSEVLAQKQVKEYEQQLEQAQGLQELANAELASARAETELERKKLYEVFMRAPAMICIFEGPAHVFKLVNPPYQQLVGDRPLLGKPIAEAMPELAGQPIFGLLDHVYRTGESFHTDEMKVQLDHDNTGGLGHNYYNFTYQPTRNVVGETDGVLVYAYEVTAQVEARQKIEQREQDLQILNEQLTAANEEIRAAYEELSDTQLALQDLNQQLEAQVMVRTRELQLSKAETEAQRNRLHQLFMEAPAPIAILAGERFVFDLVNPAYQQLLPGRKLLGNSMLSEALAELAAQPFANLLRQVYRTGETIVKKEELIPVARYEGAPLEERYFNYTLQARRDEQDKVDGIIIFAFEVTDQVEARQAAERSAERLQLITDALPVLIGYLDKEEKYRFANKAYESWFPLKSKELLGRPVREVVGEKAYKGVKEYIDRALAGERLDFDSRMPYREDFVKYIHTSYIPDIQEGKVAGFFTLVSDVTEQVQARQQIEEREKEALALTKELAAINEELKTANEQLRRTNIDLDNFVYTASHDLKAPIYNIEGLLRLLTDTLPTPVLSSEGLEGVTGMIEDSITRFKRTIEHLTEVSKLQKENNQEPVEVNLSDVVRDVRLDLSSQLEAVDAQLDVDIAACPGIHFSEKNLRSVVYNLLSNAVKYRSPERKPRIQLYCKQEGEYIALSVRDNGLGMDLAGKQKLFSMFGRLHDHVEGSGIGLYMVKKIVENADGRIEVESEVGVGSTFTVYFKS